MTSCTYCEAPPETATKLALNFDPEGSEAELAIVIARSPVPVCHDCAVALWGKRARRVYRSYMTKRKKAQP